MQRSVTKVKLTIIWDTEGPIAIDFVEKVVPIDTFCKTQLMNEFCLYKDEQKRQIVIFLLCYLFCDCFHYDHQQGKIFVEKYIFQNMGGMC